MILQTDNRLNKSINNFGCYYMSILFLLNKHIGLKLSTGIIIKYFNECVSKGYITDNNDYHAFINSAQKVFIHLGMNVKYTDAHEPPKRNCASNEIEILCLKNHLGKKHFVVGDGRGHIAFDPMGVSGRDYRLNSKRIFKIC